nr:hypothetical protein [Candidatus Levybacteria bacterium]
LLNASNVVVATKSGTIRFNTTSGMYEGTIDLGTGITQGVYQIKVKSDQYLRSRVPGIHTLTKETINVLPEAVLIAGDINNDNRLNILDYNILEGCYSDLLPAKDCTTTNQALADLNDDSKADQVDYNLFLKEISNRVGE